MRYTLASRTAAVNSGGPAVADDIADVVSLDFVLIDVLANDDASVDPTTLEVLTAGNNGEALAIPTGEIIYQAIGDPIYLAGMVCDANTPLATNYTPILSAGAGSSITALANGFQLTAGPLGAGNTPGATNAWAHVLSKVSGLGANCLLVYDMTILDASPGSSAGEAILISMTRGAGTPGFPADPNDWTVLDGTTRFTTATNTQGYRITSAPGATTANNRDQIRVRLFPEDEQIIDSNAPNTQPGSFPFPQNVTFRCVAIKFGTTFRFTYWPIASAAPADPTTITKTDIRFDDEPGPAWLAFSAMPGRSVKIENLRVANLPSVAPSGTDEITYRAKNAAGDYSEVATCDISITLSPPPPGPPPPPSGDFFADDVPNPVPITGGQPNGVYEVTTRQQLVDALAVVRPGEHIVFKANISGAGINFTRTVSGGSAAKPIVIRADTILGRRLSLSRVNDQGNENSYPVAGLNFTGVQYFTIWGIEFFETNLAFQNARNISIYRNKFHGAAYGSLWITGNGPFRIANNDISVAKYYTTDPYSQSVVKEPYWPTGNVNTRDKLSTNRRGIEMSWAGGLAYNVYIWRNHFHDFPLKFGAYTTTPYSYGGAFSVGDKVAQAANPYKMMIHHNLLQRVGGGCTESVNPFVGYKAFGFVKVKSSGSLLLQNTWLNSFGGFDHRQGFGTVMAGEFYEGPLGGIEAYFGEDSYGAPWNNQVVGGNTGLWNGPMWVGCKTGSQNPNAIAAMGGIDSTPTAVSGLDAGIVCAAHGTRYIGNDFGVKVIVGREYGASYTKKTRRVTFWGCKRNGVLGNSLGDIATLAAMAGGDEIFSKTIPSDWYVRTWAEYYGVTSIPVARKLTASEVGPNAPWKKHWSELSQSEKNTLLAGGF